MDFPKLHGDEIIDAHYSMHSQPSHPIGTLFASVVLSHHADFMKTERFATLCKSHPAFAAGFMAQSPRFSCRHCHKLNMVPSLGLTNAFCYGCSSNNNPPVWLSMNP
jgi:hypothetical protein